MPLLIHLLDARDAPSIRRSGIRAAAATIQTHAGRAELPAAVFAMPVLPNFYASHQWLRELKRRGMRTIAAAYVRMRADALVWAGRYNAEHRLLPLGHAAGLVMREADPRGWEVIIPHAVPPKAIHAIRDVPQVVGWRYFPEAHEKGPWKCLCDRCRESVRGDIKARRFRAHLIEREGADELNITDEEARRLSGKQKRRTRSD
ncbi:MAG: hypothetical protein H6809_02850 [Phycisphaeraceae bacterium]|nr:hypothetical protein [Phycisphaeraceae bacterium]